MSLSTFNTPSPIAVVLDLYVADVRFEASDRGSEWFDHWNLAAVGELRE